MLPMLWMLLMLLLPLMVPLMMMLLPDPAAGSLPDSDGDDDTLVQRKLSTAEAKAGRWVPP